MTRTPHPRTARHALRTDGPAQSGPTRAGLSRRTRLLAALPLIGVLAACKSPLDYDLARPDWRLQYNQRSPIRDL